MNTLASWAEPLARALLQQPLPRRWAHVQGVAARARGLAPVLGADADLLEAAAWLHDIGYAPSLATTGLHALDGARYLRDAQHADAMLCRLVAHHSCAIIEAGERGLAGVLGREFEPPPDVLGSALIFCDMTTSPDGEPVPVERRLAEIHHRYGPGHLVSRSIRRATPMIIAAVEQVHGRAARTALGPRGNAPRGGAATGLDVPGRFQGCSSGSGSGRSAPVTVLAVGPAAGHRDRQRQATANGLPGREGWGWARCRARWAGVPGFIEG
jgi:hypothetical protein